MPKGPSRRDALKAAIGLALAGGATVVRAEEDATSPESAPKSFMEQVAGADPLDTFLEPLRKVERRGEFLYMSEDAALFIAALGGEVEVTEGGEIYLKSSARGINQQGKEILISPEKEGQKHLLDATGEGEILAVRAGRSGRELGFVFYAPGGLPRVIVITERVIHRETDGPIFFDEFYGNTLVRPNLLPQEGQGGDMPQWQGDI